jgi:hypothetical protein
MQLVVLLLTTLVLVLYRKVNKYRSQKTALAMSCKALTEVLKLANEDVSRLRGQKHALEAQLETIRFFNYDLTQAPNGTLQLLTQGGARLTESLGSLKRAQDMGIVAWAPTAVRDKDEEIRLGITPPTKAG